MNERMSMDERMAKPSFGGDFLGTASYLPGRRDCSNDSHPSLFDAGETGIFQVFEMFQADSSLRRPPVGQAEMRCDSVLGRGGLGGPGNGDTEKTPTWIDLVTTFSERPRRRWMIVAKRSMGRRRDCFWIFFFRVGRHAFGMKSKNVSLVTSNRRL